MSLKVKSEESTTIQYSTVQYSTVQCSTVQYSTVPYSTVQYSTVQCSTVQYSTVLYCTVLYWEIKKFKGVHARALTILQRQLILQFFMNRAGREEIVAESSAKDALLFWPLSQQQYS